MQGLAALGPNMDLVQLDVCSSDSIKAAVAQIMSKAGRIDVLVRCGRAKSVLGLQGLLCLLSYCNVPSNAR